MLCSVLAEVSKEVGTALIMWNVVGSQDGAGIDVEEGYGYQTYEGYLTFAVACFLTQMLRQKSLYLKFLMSQVLQLQPQMLPC